MDLNLFKYVGLRNILARPLRAFLSVVGVGCGVALFLAIQIINRSTSDSFQKNVESVAGKANLVVSAGPAGFSESHLATIESVAGVKEAAPLVEVRAYLAQKLEKPETIMFLGVDMLREKSIRAYKTSQQDVIEDPLSFLNLPDSVILTKEFAASHGLEVDSKFEVASSQGKKVLTVRGLLEPEGPAKAYGGSLAIMDIDGVRLTFGRGDKIDRVDMLVDEAKFDQVQSELKSKLGEGFRVEKPEAYAEGLGNIIKTYQVMLSLLSTLALFVGIFMVANSASISVAERKREIGVLRAVGALKGGILWVFLAENAVLGFIGALAGVFFGRGLAHILVGSMTKSMSMQFMTTIQVQKLIFSHWDFIWGISVGVLAAVVGALLPSITAVSVSPLEAMKKQEAVSGEKRSRLAVWGLRLGLLAWLFLAVTSYIRLGAHYQVLDFANQFAGMFGAAMVGPALVGVLLLAFTQVFGARIHNPQIKIAQQNIIRNPARTGRSITSLLVALVLVIMIASLQTSFRTHIMGWIDRVLHPDLFVSSSGSLASYQLQQVHESLAQELSKIQGVRLKDGNGAYGLRFSHLEFQGRRIGMKAYDEPKQDPEFKLFDVHDRDRMTAARDMYDTSKNNVMVSENFVLHFQQKTGDKITLNTPTGAVEFTIVGVVTEFASNEGVILIDRRLYKKYFKDETIDGFGIFVSEGFTPEQVRQNIDGALGKDKNLVVALNRELKNSIKKNIDDSFVYTKAVELAALLVGMLGLLNTFLISVMERTRELGVLRAVGMTRIQLIGMILAEAIFQGAAGAFIAILIGAVLAYIWVSTSLSFVLGWVIDFTFPWLSVVKTFGIGIAVAAFAGLWPALRASKLEVREALDYE